MNDKLGDILMDNYGLFFTKSFDREFNLRDIKEQCCLVSEQQLHTNELENEAINYKLPSG